MADFYTPFTGAAGTTLESLGWHTVIAYGDYKYRLTGDGYAYGMTVGMSHSDRQYTDTEQVVTVTRRDDLTDNTLVLMARQDAPDNKYACVRIYIKAGEIKLVQDYTTYGTFTRDLAVGDSETLAVRAEGEQFTVYRNGEPVIGPVTLTKYRQGHACMGTWSTAWDKQQSGILFGSYSFADLSTGAGASGTAAGIARLVCLASGRRGAHGLTGCARVPYQQTTACKNGTAASHVAACGTDPASGNKMALSGCTGHIRHAATAQTTGTKQTAALAVNSGAVRITARAHKKLAGSSSALCLARLLAYAGHAKMPVPPRQRIYTARPLHRLHTASTIQRQIILPATR